MIHFIIGTKAQFIKMAPLMSVLESRGEHYHLLDLGQHAALTRDIVRDFGLAPKTTRIIKANKNIESYRQALSWLISCSSKLLWQRTTLLRACFQGEPGVALIHGDTLSTFLGLHLAKHAGLPVALVEAGLSSRRLFNPFPEEFIRRHAECRADTLFAPDSSSEIRLRGLGRYGKIFCTGYNTGRDAATLIIQRHNLMKPPADAGNYSILTLHRMETLSSRRRLMRIMKFMFMMAEHSAPIRFFLHGPTQLALRRIGLLKKIECNPQFVISPLLSYPEFIRQILHCHYLFTDGGSIQEEASYFKTPCLILRQTTERQSGLGVNSRLASYNVRSDLEFLRQAFSQRHEIELDSGLDASHLLLDFVKELENP